MNLANEFNRISTAQLILDAVAKECAKDETLTEILNVTISQLNRAMHYIECEAKTTDC